MSFPCNNGDGCRTDRTACTDGRGNLRLVSEVGEEADRANGEEVIDYSTIRKGVTSELVFTNHLINRKEVVL